jgi:hypothetical protein
VLTIPTLLKAEEGNEKLKSRRAQVNKGLMQIARGRECGGGEDGSGIKDEVKMPTTLVINGTATSSTSASSTSITKTSSAVPFRCIDVATALDELREGGDGSLWDRNDGLHLTKRGYKVLGRIVYEVGADRDAVWVQIVMKCGDSQVRVV